MPEGKKPLRPTIIKAVQKRSNPVGRQPTAIPGVQRLPLSVDLEQLKTLVPGTRPVVITAAGELLRTVVIGNLDQRKAMLWGQDVQKSYSDIVSKVLALAQTPGLKRAQVHLARMIEIMSAIDPLAICDASTVLDRFAKNVNKKIDTPAEMAQVQVELQQLIGHLDASLNELLTLKIELEKSLSLLDVVALNVEVCSLSALYLAQVLASQNADLSTLFSQRSTSLTQTLAQIRQDATVRQIQIDQPVRLISAIQSVILVSLPGLLSALAALHSSSKVTPTQARETSFQLEAFLENLRSL